MNKQIKLILPKNGVLLEPKEGERIYFLAGPIRGALDWQAKAIKMLHEKDPDCFIVCPCRYDSNHELFQFSLPPTYNEPVSDDEREILTRKLEFPNQTMWERYYLDRASYYGAVIFWLPCEDKENPRKKEEGPYARDTYGELGRWSMKSANPRIFSCEPYPSAEDRINLVVGAEKEFHGLSVIQKNFDADHGLPFPIHPLLEETISAAVNLGKKTNPQPMLLND